MIRDGMTAVRLRCLVAAAAFLSVLCLTPGAARADGDPASDFLVSQPVFTPFQPPSEILRQQLTALATAAKRQGFPIRVAVIHAPTDLGAVSALFGKPETYARFLGAEIRFFYRGRLLVVMPHGYGYTRNGKPVPGGAGLLRSIAKPSGGTPDQVTTAAIRALRRLAAASGHRLPVNPPLVGSSGPGTVPGRSQSLLHRDAVLIIAVIVAVASATGLCATFLRRRPSSR
jgi:hypothetical protein